MNTLTRRSDDELLALPGVGKLAVEVLHDQAICQGEQ